MEETIEVEHSGIVALGDGCDQEMSTVGQPLRLFRCPALYDLHRIENEVQAMQLNEMFPEKPSGKRLLTVVVSHGVIQSASEEFR